MKMYLAVVIALIGLRATGESGPMQNVSAWDVTDFGAVSDGSTDNTAAFQKALDTAAEKMLEAGKLMSGASMDS